MQWQSPRLVKLRLANGQQPGRRVKIAAVQTQRLTAAHPGGKDQPDKGLHCCGGQRRVQPPSGGHQCGDVGLRIQIRRGPSGAGGQQVGGRYLGVRVDALPPSGKTTHHAQSLGVPDRGTVRRQGGPLQGELSGHGVGAGRFGEVDELLEQPARADEPETQRTADREIVGHRTAQAAHCAPAGHGRATVPNAT